MALFSFERKESSNGNGELVSVEEQLKRLTRPVRVSTLSAISGLSEATLRKKIEQGKLRAFKRSGIVLIEPKDFLEYWCKGKNDAIYNPALFARRPLNVIGASDGVKRAGELHEERVSHSFDLSPVMPVQNRPQQLPLLLYQS